MRFPHPVRTIHHLGRRIGALAARLGRDRRGATMILVGFAMIPLLAAVGMSIDYARAARLQTKMNAIADAAALAAVTTPMMSKTSAEACIASRLVFTNQVTGLSSLTINTNDPAQFSVVVTDNANAGACAATTGSVNTSYQRVATVTWKGTADNLFGGILGLMKSPIGGVSTAQAATAPNIDFYVLLDTSGSMALPSTSAGLTLLKSKTGGCAFACHSTNDATAIRKNGTRGDYYSVATSYGIPLRMDDAKKAISDMMTLAGNMATNNKATYQAALATFAASDSRAPNKFRMRQPLTPTLSLVSTASANTPTSLYYKNGWPTSDFYNGDIDSASSDAFTQMRGLIPAPGNGTKQQGDKPQAMLIVITDGMRDEYRSDGRPEVAFDTALCDTIKAKNIGIAILYTEYLPEAIKDDWWSVEPSQGNVLNRLPQIEPALKACVSRPEYYTKVSTDDDISAALNNLFRTLVKTAYVTK